MQYKIKPARHIIKLFLKIMKFEYLAFPPDKIYYLKFYPCQRMIRHEKKHLEQYKRDGVIKYFFRWWWQYITVGYENIDYEIEARRAENATD